MRKNLAVALLAIVAIGLVTFFDRSVLVPAVKEHDRVLAKRAKLERDVSYAESLLQELAHHEQTLDVVLPWCAVPGDWSAFVGELAHVSGTDDRETWFQRLTIDDSHSSAATLTLRVAGRGDPIPLERFGEHVIELERPGHRWIESASNVLASTSSAGSDEALLSEWKLVSDRDE